MSTNNLIYQYDVYINIVKLKAFSKVDILSWFTQSKSNLKQIKIQLHHLYTVNPMKIFTKTFKQNKILFAMNGSGVNTTDIRYTTTWKFNHRDAHKMAIMIYNMVIGRMRAGEVEFSRILEEVCQQFDQTAFYLIYPSGESRFYLQTHPNSEYSSIMANIKERIRASIKTGRMRYVIEKEAFRRRNFMSTTGIYMAPQPYIGQAYPYHPNTYYDPTWGGMYVGQTRMIDKMVYEIYSEVKSFICESPNLQLSLTSEIRMLNYTFTGQLIVAVCIILVFLIILSIFLPRGMSW